MRARNSTTSWGWVARLLHWVMAALILFMLGLGTYMVTLVPDLLRQFDLIQLHKSWGFVVFCLALLRLAWRLIDRVSPAEPLGTPRWQAAAARTVHRLLYALILVMPLSGWVRVSASPTQDLLQMQNMVFGLFPMPDPWVPGIAALSDRAGALHLYAAVLLALVLVIHVGAALKHALIDRDDVLHRMTVGR